MGDMEKEHPEVRSSLSTSPGAGKSVTHVGGRAAAVLGLDTQGPTTPAPAGTKRLTANLPLDAAEALDKTAASTGFNKLTTIVRAIRVFADLIEASSRGAEVVIKEADGSATRLILR